MLTREQPITDVTSADVACNGGINPLLTPVSNKVINVPAGATLTAEWHHGGSGPDPTDKADPIEAVSAFIRQSFSRPND
jgi:cellulase